MKTKIVQAIENYKDRYYLALAVMITAMYAVTPTQADLFSEVGGMIQEVGNGIYSIAMPLGGLMALVALLVALTSSGQGFDRAISWLKKIIIVLVVMFSLNFIIGLIDSLAGGGQYSFDMR